MKFSIIVTMLSAVFFISACNNEASDKTTDAGKDSTGKKDTTNKTATSTTAAFVPFKVINITQTVKDFAAWKKLYDAHDSVRQASGLTKLAVCRDDANPNKVLVFLKVADLQKAKDFAANPELKAVMQKAGVVGAPAFIYSNVLRFEESPAEMKGRVRVGFKVKDFDAWLKAYDAEGKATRAANGLIDRGVSRDINDPSTVYVTLAISDPAKAKARINSPELKKIMDESGVISKPVIDFYTAVD
jgi:quinol monooxygenase YgiN